MARGECYSVGCCHSLRRRFTQLPHVTGVKNLPRDLRGDDWSIIDTHKLAMVHQVGTSSTVFIVVHWPWDRPDRWGRHIVRLSTDSNPREFLGWVENDVPHPRNCYDACWNRNDTTSTRYADESYVVDRDGKSCSA